jgi:ADP-ribose pyrophosphatase YjhB (NUDIX family)
MRPPDAFRRCPSCGAPAAAPGATPFVCGACGFTYYFNPAVAAAALVVAPDGRGLFIRRSSEPARGKLAFVGGFVDPGESLEEALCREVLEEVNLELTSVRYLSSHRNDYAYRGLTYTVVDVFFVGHADELDAVAARDGVERVEWLDPYEVDPADVAFASMRDALAVYCASARPARGA